MLSVERQMVLLVSLCLASLGFGGAGVQAQDISATWALAPGWNLIALPPGARFEVEPRTLLTSGADGSTYQPLDPGQGASPGHGYWVFVEAPSLLSMVRPLGDGVTVSVTAAPGEWVLIGDTTGLYPAMVTGADAIYTYDPQRGYEMHQLLFPGQGAWAISLNGGTITVGSGSPSGPPPRSG
jgi:hypothetical protein